MASKKMDAAAGKAISALKTTAQARKANNPLERQAQAAGKTKKPNGDYLRLDLVTRDAAGNVERDYKTYVGVMAGIQGISSTKYIQKLIDADMAVNKDVFQKVQALKEDAI